MKFYVGVTDPRWFSYLRALKPEDVNFWRPGMTTFKAVERGSPFVFKLKGRINKIVGLGFFYEYIRLPFVVAWETFGNGNGFDFFSEFVSAIEDLRRERRIDSQELGCIVLTNPVFFDDEDWLDVPESWRKTIVSGVSYSTEADAAGRSLWARIEDKLQKYLKQDLDVSKSLAMIDSGVDAQYRYIMSKVRIGQASFRVGVTSAYEKRCSVTGEKTLPALEAAHIKSYARSGPHLTSNGLLLRSDLHKLFDAGYITVTPQLRLEVSSRIKSEFSNGREYYQFHGKSLIYVPNHVSMKPRKEYLEWHNENVYRS